MSATGAHLSDAATATAGPAAQTRRFLCPSCSRPSLEAVVAPGVAARCASCRYETDDLLVLVPVRPVSLAALVLGEGAVSWLRLGLFAGVTGALVMLVVHGR